MQEFTRKGQICGDEKDEGNMQTFQKNKVGGKPGELDSEKIKAYSNTSHTIFGEGLGLPLTRVSQTTLL